jgi:hypothetical protein
MIKVSRHLKLLWRTYVLNQTYLDYLYDLTIFFSLQGNIQGVVNLLQNHIKQWSFIEAQLLEPNVNLGMVGIGYLY